MEFENGGMGQCVVIKNSNTPYTLIYSITGKQFVIATSLDFDTGNWLHGEYFGQNIDDALSCFNKIIKESQHER